MMIRSVQRLVLLVVALILVPIAGAVDVTAVLEITPPTTRTDGTALPAAEIAHHTVYYAVGGAPNAGSLHVVMDGTVQEVSVELAPRAEPYVLYAAATTTDTKGREGPMSTIQSMEFRVESDAPPGAPTIMRFNIGCGAGGECSVTPLQ